MSELAADSPGAAETGANSGPGAPSGALAGTLAGATVLVIGDVMLDEYLWGDVERISPEAPVPVVRVTRRSAAPGGAGNAAAGIVALGGHALLASVVGDDAGSTLLLTALRTAGVRADGVLTLPGRITTTKSRLIARGQHVVRTDSEDCSPLAAGTEEQLLAFAAAQLPFVDAVVLSDYGKGVLSAALAAAVICLATDRGLPVIADPTGSDYRKYRGATVVTPSVDEVAAAVRQRVRTTDDLVKAGQELVTQLGGTQVLITRGPDGMWLLSEAGVTLDIPTRARSVYDVTGAGDTVVATLAVALGRGLDLPTAIRLANAAAGIAVAKAGTACVTLAELTTET